MWPWRTRREDDAADRDQNQADHALKADRQRRGDRSRPGRPSEQAAASPVRRPQTWRAHPAALLARRRPPPALSCSSTPPGNSATRAARAATRRSGRKDPSSSGISLDATSTPRPLRRRVRAGARRSRPWRRRRRRASARRAAAGAARRELPWRARPSAGCRRRACRPRCAARGGRMSNVVIDRRGAAVVLARRDMKPKGEMRRSTDMTRLRPTLSRSMRPLPRRSSVTKARPARRARRDRGQPARARRRPRRRPASARAAGRAIERGQQLGAPGAHHAGEADDLAGVHAQRDVARRLPAGAVRACGESARDRGAAAGGRTSRRARGIEFVERPADQQAHELAPAARWRGSRRRPPVAQHRHAVGDARHFFQAVRDIDDADAALGACVAHHLEQPLGLRRGQRRGRLVHHQNARGVGQRLDDRHHLPLADRQIARPAVDVDVDADRREPGARLLAHRALGRGAPARIDLAPEEQVGGDVEARNEVEFLEDRGDAARPAPRADRRSAPAAPSIVHLAVVRRDARRRECSSASILPAPFSPSSACTSPPSGRNRRRATPARRRSAF